ncbi:SGNH/GDSL hydrolase family protein [Hymenobacter busanensis]|uniref:SGNH/GDSL hydrolase family protein n=1 Tax=Hymenobacter busanensis TaxID=2607656 RepID=A0A7L4ZYM0_9BACT|nr:SGNH/GDSL hydrolase family protein [Hymenobacter busanensis]KAA9331420.1 SGNH/GDSL hydrolase family protein [Hymenobacter busanensis]QHJ08574.1 SGNH/GDSL hydrolase family protein [Hymenobacter busanensis]
MNTSLKFVLPGCAVLGLALTGCQPELDETNSARGQADFSKYIAVGNSLTAGYSDGGLYREGQLNSYPNLLAQQFRTANGGEFKQPLFSEDQANGSGYLRLTTLDLATRAFTLGNVTNNLAVRGQNPTLYTKYTEPVQNLGVPGIRVADVLTPGYGSTAGNAYYERLLPTADALKPYATFVQERMAAENATFFTCWLGNNDVLGYATSGGVSPITSTATFTTNYTAIITALTANGARGVVATIPNVTDIPFFRTAGPAFRVKLETNPAAAGGPIPQFVATTGPLTNSPATRKVILTSDINNGGAIGTAAGRQLIPLTAQPYLALLGQRTGKAWRDLYAQARPSLGGASLGQFLLAQGVDTTAMFGLSAGNPLPTSLVLDDTEQAAVATATTAFNTAIRSQATAKNLGVADMNVFFTNIAANGINTSGINNTTGFISGNLFSLDGVHPTPRGYAVVANEFLRNINDKYGSNIPGVNASLYRGVLFP